MWTHTQPPAVKGVNHVRTGLGRTRGVQRLHAHPRRDRDRSILLGGRGAGVAPRADRAPPSRGRLGVVGRGRVLDPTESGRAVRGMVPRRPGSGRARKRLSSGVNRAQPGWVESGERQEASISDGADCSAPARVGLARVT